MKKYHNVFSEYGQSIVGNAIYWQKMGLGMGIISRIKDKMRDMALSLRDYKTRSGLLHVVVVIPTKPDSWIKHECPLFHYNGKYGIIDMISFDETDVNFHFMKCEKGTNYVNGGWHTVREGLTFEDTATLFEYVVDILDSLIILAPDESEMYNETGAIGVRVLNR